MAEGSAPGAELEAIAEDAEWERHPDRTIGAARALYLRQPADTKLWHSRKSFVKIDLDRLADILGPLESSL